MDGNARQKRMENYNMRDICTNRKIIKNNKMAGKEAGLKHKKTLEKQVQQTTDQLSIIEKTFNRNIF